MCVHMWRVIYSEGVCVHMWRVIYSEGVCVCICGG